MPGLLDTILESGTAATAVSSSSDLTYHDIMNGMGGGSKSLSHRKSNMSNIDRFNNNLSLQSQGQTQSNGPINFNFLDSKKSSFFFNEAPPGPPREGIFTDNARYDAPFPNTGHALANTKTDPNHLDWTDEVLDIKGHKNIINENDDDNNDIVGNLNQDHEASQSTEVQDQVPEPPSFPTTIQKQTVTKIVAGSRNQLVSEWERQHGLPVSSNKNNRDSIEDPESDENDNDIDDQDPMMHLDPEAKKVLAQNGIKVVLPKRPSEILDEMFPKMISEKKKIKNGESFNHPHRITDELVVARRVGSDNKGSGTEHSMDSNSAIKDNDNLNHDDIKAKNSKSTIPDSDTVQIVRGRYEEVLDSRKVTVPGQTSSKEKKLVGVSAPHLSLRKFAPVKTKHISNQAASNKLIFSSSRGPSMSRLNEDSTNEAFRPLQTDPMRLDLKYSETTADQTENAADAEEAAKQIEQIAQDKEAEIRATNQSETAPQKIELPDEGQEDLEPGPDSGNNGASIYDSNDPSETEDIKPNQDIVHNINDMNKSGVKQHYDDNGNDQESSNPDDHDVSVNNENSDNHDQIQSNESTQTDKLNPSSDQDPNAIKKAKDPIANLNLSDDVTPEEIRSQIHAIVSKLMSDSQVRMLPPKFIKKRKHMIDAYTERLVQGAKQNPKGFKKMIHEVKKNMDIFRIRNNEYDPDVMDEVQNDSTTKGSDSESRNRFKNKLDKDGADDESIPSDLQVEADKTAQEIEDSRRVVAKAEDQ